MREIKFRAWDKVNKELFHDLEARNWKKEKGFVSINSIFRTDRFELMQFTGLKDKNGKEIYEGDILFYEEDTKDGNPDIRSPNHTVVCYPGRFSCSSLVVNKYWKVIGNIYENPELLGA